ncbi:MAG: DUF4347 domain-containing protein [Kofleriaceae bacterium]
MKYLVFDKTDGALSFTWARGAQLYRSLGRIDGAIGVASWREAFAWLVAQPGPIDELQYWGHGKWGCVMADDDALDTRALAPAHAKHRELEAVRAQLAPDALIWFRTCETFGATSGLDFAARFADWTGVRVAGHTHIIGFHQSGLHGVAPGVTPDWRADEGLARGSAEAPERARKSAPWRPHTITCLAGQVPAAWFSTGCRAAAPA